MIDRGLCVSIYTQITDVEDEINGLYTYDRQVCKVDDDVMRKIAEDLRTAFENRFKIVERYTYDEKDTPSTCPYDSATGFLSSIEFKFQIEINVFVPILIQCKIFYCIKPLYNAAFSGRQDVISK